MECQKERVYIAIISYADFVNYFLNFFDEQVVHAYYYLETWYSSGFGHWIVPCFQCLVSVVVCRILTNLGTNESDIISTCYQYDLNRFHNKTHFKTIQHSINTYPCQRPSQLKYLLSPEVDSRYKELTKVHMN